MRLNNNRQNNNNIQNKFNTDIDLDADLNLFDEDSWNYINISTYSHKQNFNSKQSYEYNIDFNAHTFNGDTIYERIKVFLLYFILTSITFLLLFLVVNTVIYLRTPDVNYLGVKKATYEVKYVDGETLPNENIIESSKVLTKYFEILNKNLGYNNLDDLCKNESTFNKYYKNYIGNMKENYDINDCYARALKSIGLVVSIDKVDKVIRKDGVDYCYVYLNIPNDTDINEYIYSYKYNISKYFQSHLLCEENILIFFCDMLKDKQINCSSNLYCIQLEQQEDGSYKIIDDIQITTNCVAIFTNVVSEMSKMLGSISIKN